MGPHCDFSPASPPDSPPRLPSPPLVWGGRGVESRNSLASSRGLEAGPGRPLGVRAGSRYRPPFTSPNAPARCAWSAPYFVGFRKERSPQETLPVRPLQVRRIPRVLELEGRVEELTGALAVTLQRFAKINARELARLKREASTADHAGTGGEDPARPATLAPSFPRAVETEPLASSSVETGGRSSTRADLRARARSRGLLPNLPS